MKDPLLKKIDEALEIERKRSQGIVYGVNGFSGLSFSYGHEYSKRLSEQYAVDQLDRLADEEFVAHAANTYRDFLLELKRHRMAVLRAQSALGAYATLSPGKYPELEKALSDIDKILAGEGE